MNSYWLENRNKNKIRKIDNNKEADVCIIGAGMVGMTTAYYLTKQGYSVIIVEKDSMRK